jgi:hypothetical protein
MEITHIDETVQAITLVAVTIITGLFVFKKLMKDWLTSDTESSIIKLMHTELDRMSEQNTALSLELGRLHNEVILLNQELHKLSLENRRLQTEVIALTAEVSSFKRMRAEETNGKIKIN